MSGVPGSGKSTIANLIAQSMDAVVVNHDLIRSFFLNHAINFDQAAKLAYDFQWTLAEDILKQGRSVIMDSTCNYQETLDAGMMLAKNHNVEYKYIQCKVHDLSLIDERLRNRVPLRSQRTGIQRGPPDADGSHSSQECIALFKRRMETPILPEDNTIVVDSTRSIEDCVSYITKQMAIPERGLDNKVDR